MMTSSFESFSYTNKDVVFDWAKTGNNIKSISLAQFNVFSGLVVI